MEKATELYKEQLADWNEFRERVEQLDKVELREIKMGNYSIFVQFNPARSVSSGAKLDKETIAKRKCFLCEENRPSVQKSIRLNERFILLVNPFPILKGHLTIPSICHQPQAIKDCIEDFISFCKELPAYTLLYNGPQSGASAPDHLHFQAVFKGQLPFEHEMKSLKKRELSEWEGSKMEEFLDYGRKCIHIQSNSVQKVKSFFEQIYKQYQLLENSDVEPKMNLFGFFEEEQYHLFIFPRKTHRPRQYFEQGENHRMISPGAIDIAGIFVCPIKKDFDEFDSALAADILSQVAY